MCLLLVLLKSIFPGSSGIYIKAPPVEGKANQYLLGLIAKEFKVSKTRTELISGTQSRDKCIAIHSPTRLPDWFLELTGKSLKDHGNF
jgi:uncharacterized protein (TIGR00251 family)